MSIYINPNEKSNQEINKIMIGSVVPRPIALVSTLSATGVINVAPFSYFNIVSSNPPMISISVRKEDGVLKDTANNIFNQKEFVVHIVTEHILEDANQSSMHLPSDQSELSHTRLKATSSKWIEVPGIEQAKVRMECVLERWISFEHTDLIIGRIVGFVLSEDVYQDGKIELKELKPVGRLAGNNYAIDFQEVSLERPK